MTNTNDEIDEQTATEQLRELEQAALAGHPVEPAKLAEARERVNLAGLFARGRAQREEAARAAKAAEKIAAAKRSAVSDHSSFEDLGRDLEAARYAITEGIRDLIRDCAVWNERIQTVGREMEAAGLPSTSPGYDNGAEPGWGGFYAAGDFGTFAGVRIDGVSQVPIDAGREIIDVLTRALRAANHPMPRDGSRSALSRLERS